MKKINHEMKFIDKLKSKARALRKELTALYYVYQNPETGILPKLIIIITLAYALSPVDLIPDFIPVLGYLDDLIIVPALISLSIKLIPDSVMNKARAMAEDKPVKLKKNRITAVVFILIWIILVIAIVMAVINTL